MVHSALQAIRSLLRGVTATAGAGLVAFSSAVAYASGTLGYEALATNVQRRGRTAPHANFNWFTADFTVAECKGPGQALLVQDVADVFQNKFGALISGQVCYVHPSGSDTNGGSSWRDAFLTLAKALRNTNDGVIYLWPGSYALSDFRYTDSYGDHPKKIIAPYGGVVLKVIGDDVSSLTWTLDGDYGGMYSCGPATANAPIRLLRKDLLDPYGEPTPMPLYATRAALSGVNFGWAYEANHSEAITGTFLISSNTITTASTKGITLGMTVTGAGIPASTTVTGIVTNTSFTISNNTTSAGTNVALTVAGKAIFVRDAMSANVNTTTKSQLTAVYGDSSGDNRTLLYSTTSYWENITFWGYISVLKVAGQAIPQFWAKNCAWKYGGTHGLLNEGGYTYTQNCRAYRQAADGANYNTVAGTIAQGVEINYTTQFAGDVDTYGSSQALNPQGNGTNKNGSSNHDSYVVRVNGVHVECFGPNIADTATSYSWNLGVTTGHNALAPNVAPATPRYGILNQGNNAWCDGCSATGADGGFNSDSAAAVNLFNSFGSQVITNGGTFVSYVPS